MAIVRMQKIIIAAHRSQAAELLENLQEVGIVQLLDAERAMVSKEWPELQVNYERPKDLEGLVDRLEKVIAFLESHAEGPSQTSLFQPYIAVDTEKYSHIVSGHSAVRLLEKSEEIQSLLIQLGGELEQVSDRIGRLLPWRGLSGTVQEFFELSSATVLMGMLPAQHLAETEAQLAELGTLLQEVGQKETRRACVVVCLNEQASDVHKILRNADFEPVSFEGMEGTVPELIATFEKELQKIEEKLASVEKQAAQLAEDRLKLKILYDHSQNLLHRTQTQATSPATEHTVFYEGWVKRGDYSRLSQIVGRFDACSVFEITPGDGEEPPVEIENNAMNRPFESITRLYGMPAPSDVDPTVFLAPFFALFFGLCLTDAAYGIILVVLLAWVLKKMKGDKKALWMLMICSVLTVVAGAITGSWFADAVQTLLPQDEGTIGVILDTWRKRIMLFDPMQQPLIFIGISLGLGFLQVLFGLGIGFFNLLRQGKVMAAIYEKLTWLIMLNSLLVVALAGNEVLPAWMGRPAGFVALIMAVIIFWFTERHGGLAARIGNGTFAVFSTVFYLGDMLSYVRIMALGMVTAGLGMAVNILTQLLMDIPYVGFILGLLLFVFGHAVNIALSLLSAFVHSLRLQFVEFFPKFFTGGGREFQPLRNHYKHVTIVPDQTK